MLPNLPGQGNVIFIGFGAENQTLWRGGCAVSPAKIRAPALCRHGLWNRAVAQADRRGVAICRHGTLTARSAQGFVFGE